MLQLIPVFWFHVKNKSDTTQYSVERIDKLTNVVKSNLSYWTLLWIIFILCTLALDSFRQSLSWNKKGKKVWMFWKNIQWKYISTDRCFRNIRVHWCLHHFDQFHALVIDSRFMKAFVIYIFDNYCCRIWPSSTQNCNIVVFRSLNLGLLLALNYANKEWKLILPKSNKLVYPVNIVSVCVYWFGYNFCSLVLDFGYFEGNDNAKWHVWCGYVLYSF